MLSESAPTMESSREAPTQAQATTPRFWPAFTMVTLFWLGYFIVKQIEWPYFYRFIYGMASATLLTIPYFIWWWRNRRIPRNERALGFLLIILGGVVVFPLCDRSIGVFGLVFSGLPLMLTVWTVWMAMAWRTGVRRRDVGSVVTVLLTWSVFTLGRVDGLDSDLRPTVRWRWQLTPEELFLAQSKQHAKTESSAAQATGLPTGFRGPNRDGMVTGVAIGTEWNAMPPKLVWRQRVGPAWSSVIVVGDLLFTQEQRGDREAVVCYEAANGAERWVHEDKARFWESVSGVGPRATPTFDGSRLFTFGATGILNCLDANTGEVHWTRNVAADANASLPMWGYSGSPLVVGDIVIVHAGGAVDKGVLAYRVDTGVMAWGAAAGTVSYSSPQLVILCEERQVLMLSDIGLTSVDPKTGTVLWQAGAAMPGAPRTVQPHAIGTDQLLVATYSGSGMALLNVTRDGSAWNANAAWESKDLKPEFPDFVIHDNHAYGFDGSIFACLELGSGKRCWKAGRYGRGQVMLLADQGLLLVTSEGGELILLRANPERHEELGRFQSLNGKTWNHPVIANGRLYLRNAEEMACYELPAMAR